MSFRLVLKSVTLNGVMALNLRYFNEFRKPAFQLINRFFTIIFAVFLHDLASVYQMSSKRGAKISKVGHVTSTRPI